MTASRSGQPTPRWRACPPWQRRSAAPQTGSPVGAQLLGPLYEDDTPITFAELLGEVAGGYEPPPI